MSITTILLILFVVGLSGYSKYKKTLVEHLVTESVDEADDEVEEEEEFAASAVQSLAGAEPRKESVAVTPAAAVASEAPARQFDLRQAVVAQVILENKYISEINQKNQ